MGPLLHSISRFTVVENKKVLTKVGEAVPGSNREPRAHRSVDHRRPRLSQTRQAFGRRRSPMLQPARQAGQLPGRRIAVSRQSPCRACRLLGASICPKESASDEERRRKVGVPEEIKFQTKLQFGPRADRSSLREQGSRAASR